MNFQGAKRLRGGDEFNATDDNNTDGGGDTDSDGDTQVTMIVMVILGVDDIGSDGGGHGCDMKWVMMALAGL